MPTTLTSRTTRRAGLVGAAALALSVALTGCGAGFDAQTIQPYQAAEGVNADSGTVAVRNVLVIADEKGAGTLHGVLVNTGKTADRLVSIAVDPSVTDVKLAGSKAVPLPPGQSVTLPPATGTPITTTGAKPGRMVKVTLTFESAGPITAQLPVITTDHFSPSPRPDEGEH